MNNSQFITALKKSLAGLDKASRNDIVQEIKSHAAESGSLLEEKFGSPEQLAKQYLEGEIIAQPLSKKVWGMSKSLIKVIAIGVIAIIAFFAISAYFFTKDKFNYADENATELTQGTWQSEEWLPDTKLNIDQASVVIYWHNDNSIRSKCDGSGPEKENESNYIIRQSHCYIYLPKVETSINAEQSQIVMVKPQASLFVNARQASIKVAENGEKYQYVFDKEYSEIDGLNSIDNAEFKLHFKTKESMVSSYKY